MFGSAPGNAGGGRKKKKLNEETRMPFAWPCGERVERRREPSGREGMVGAGEDGLDLASLAEDSAAKSCADAGRSHSERSLAIATAGCDALPGYREVLYSVPQLTTETARKRARNGILENSACFVREIVMQAELPG